MMRPPVSFFLARSTDVELKVSDSHSHHRRANITDREAQIENLCAQPYCSFCCKGVRVEFKPQSQWQIFDEGGRRKYLNCAERERLLRAANGARHDIGALCHVLAYTGCRISEALALTPAQLDLDSKTLTFRTLKRRQISFRTVPIPPALCAMLRRQTGALDAPFWPMHRVTAWRHIKRLLALVEVEGPMACCRGFRHGFGIHAASSYVPPNLIQKWMGHALASTTAIYLDAVGAEERKFAERMW